MAIRNYLLHFDIKSSSDRNNEMNSIKLFAIEPIFEAIEQHNNLIFYRILPYSNDLDVTEAGTAFPLRF